MVCEVLLLSAVWFLFVIFWLETISVWVFLCNFYHDHTFYHRHWGASGRVDRLSADEPGQLLYILGRSELIIGGFQAISQSDSSRDRETMRNPALLLSFQVIFLGNLAFSHNHMQRRDCDCTDGVRNAGPRGPEFGMTHGHPREHTHTAHAICLVRPNARSARPDENNVTGEIRIRRQRSNGTEITLDLRGFPTSGNPHGIHVHEFGDLSGGCETVGGHFNPHNERHGSHAGDLGNFRPDSDGALRLTLADVRLHVHGPHSIAGRSIVIHANEDDLGHRDDPGSLVHGNAGDRLACCVIAIASGRGWPEGARPPLSIGGRRKKTQPRRRH